MEKLEATNSSIELVEQGKIDFKLLNGPSSFKPSETPIANLDLTSSSISQNTPEVDIPKSGYLCAKSKGSDFFSIGWRFCPSIEFDRSLLFSWLSGIAEERLKGVFITTEGIFAYNISDNVLTEMELDETTESRIEIISKNEDLNFEKELMNCLA